MSRYRNIYIDAGADFKAEFDIYDENGNPLVITTGFTGSGGVKTFFDSNGYTPFDVSIVNGKLVLELNGESTGNMRGGTHVFDAFINSEDRSLKVIEGKAFVTERVTQP